MDIKEFKNLHYDNIYWDENSAEDLAIEFAKYHVKEVLKTAENEVNGNLDYVYPLENIK